MGNRKKFINFQERADFYEYPGGSFLIYVVAKEGEFIGHK